MSSSAVRQVINGHRHDTVAGLPLGAGPDAGQRQPAQVVAALQPQDHRHVAGAVPGGVDEADRAVLFVDFFLDAVALLFAGHFHVVILVALAELVLELLRGEIDAIAGNGLQLIERAAAEAKPDGSVTE